MADPCSQRVRARRRFAPLRVLATALALGAAASGGADDDGVTLYQWTDSAGVQRYTPDLGRVPGSARDSVVTIRPRAPEAPDAPVYFDPNPREEVVAVPDEPRDSGTETGHADVPRVSGDRPEATEEEAEKAREARIRELEAQIAADEEALKAAVSAPGDAESDTTVSPEMREIAARLPRLQAELESLRRRRPASAGQ